MTYTRSADDITQAISLLATGKSPGPSSFPIEFFRCQTDILAQPLLKLYVEAREAGSLPHKSLIVPILKPGKPAHLCTSYRSILLINSKAKILGKILAMRMITVVTDLVHIDQSGFMPHRSTRHNIRRMQNAISITRLYYPLAI